MKINIKCDKRLTKEFKDLAKNAVQDLVKHNKSWGIQDGNRTRVICDRKVGDDGAPFFVLQFCKVYGMFNRCPSPFAHGTATVEEGA